MDTTARQLWLPNTPTQHRTLSDEEKVALELVHRDAVEVVERVVRGPHQQHRKVLVQPRPQQPQGLGPDRPEKPLGSPGLELFPRHGRRRARHDAATHGSRVVDKSKARCA